MLLLLPGTPAHNPNLCPAAMVRRPASRHPVWCLVLRSTGRGGRCSAALARCCKPSSSTRGRPPCSAASSPRCCARCQAMQVRASLRSIVVQVLAAVKPAITPAAASRLKDGGSMSLRCPSADVPAAPAPTPFPTRSLLWHVRGPEARTGGAPGHPCDPAQLTVPHDRGRHWRRRLLGGRVPHGCEAGGRQRWSERQHSLHAQNKLHQAVA